MIRSMLGARALVWCLSLPLAMEPVGWEQTFPPGATSSRINARDEAVLVVSAGPASEHLDAATKALVEGLRRGNGAKRVLDGQALGDVSALDDASIVAKAAAQPVAQIIIVRVDTSEAEPYAVVTTYSKSGEALDGFSAELGQAIEAGTSGVSAATAVESSLEDEGITPEADDAKLEAYNQRRVYFDEGFIIQASGSTAVVSKTFIPHAGDGRLLKGPEFYTHIGRNDLAKKYRTRKGVRIGLIAGGSVVTAVGLIVMTVALFPRNECSFDSPDYDQCQNDERTRLRNGTIAGSIVSIVGIGGLVAGFVVKPHPIKADEALQLGRQHNRDLAQELGIDKKRVNVDVTAQVLDRGGGLAVVGQF